jgi:hypothetical protein
MVLYRCPDCHRRRKRELYRKHHPAPPRSTTRNAAKVGRQVSKLADWYVRKILSQNTSVPESYWPPHIVDLKRATLQLKRLCKLPK